MNKKHVLAPMFELKLDSSLTMAYVQCVRWRDLEIQAHLLAIIALLRKTKLLLQSKHLFQALFQEDLFQARNELGHFHTLVEEMKLKDREYFFRYFR